MLKNEALLKELRVTSCIWFPNHYHWIRKKCYNFPRDHLSLNYLGRAYNYKLTIKFLRLKLNWIDIFVHWINVFMNINEMSPLNLSYLNLPPHTLQGRYRNVVLDWELSELWLRTGARKIDWDRYSKYANSAKKDIMATNALAAMLDELMGRDRNLAPTEKRNTTTWFDSDVRMVLTKHNYSPSHKNDEKALVM